MKKILTSLAVAGLLIAPVAQVTTATAAPTSVQTISISTETVAQRQAVRKARSYLSMMAFSRKGLIKQLKYEGFSTAQATYGVDATHTSWKRQAAKKAKSYLDMMSFSRSGLIRQLKYEGFTTSQATYGVNKVGL